MSKKLMLLLAGLLIGVASLVAQKRVTGTVTDNTGEPLIGVSVKVDGAKAQAITNEYGKFELKNVPASAKTLTVSFLGMKSQQVKVADNLNVTLEYDDNVLDEAIVVAYGVAKKGSFTGSVSQMKAKDLQKMQVANVTKGIEGQLAGVQVFVVGLRRARQLAGVGHAVGKRQRRCTFRSACYIQSSIAFTNFRFKTYLFRFIYVIRYGKTCCKHISRTAINNRFG